VSSRAAGPLSDAISSEANQRVHALLALLPPEQARVLSLKILGGMTTGEIAELTGEPLAAVKSRLRYALEKVHAIVVCEERHNHE
jgi:RNA polymerase sigma-70 factor (ECF subfamily)